MKFLDPRRIVWLVSLWLLASGCCTTTYSTKAPTASSSEVIKADFPPWPYFITVTPEQISAARSDPKLQGVPLDSEAIKSENWGQTWEGLRLSITLEKAVFTNGEPVMARVTLRNSGHTVKYFVVGPYPEEKDTKITLMRGENRILGVDDPKPGESLAERLSHIRSGSSPGPLPISPGTQRQFFRDLSKMFDLTFPGIYSAQAEREVIALHEVPDLPGYLKGINSKLRSATATFRMVDSTLNE